MKKIVSILIAMIMALGLVACGGKKEGDNEADSGASEASAVSADTEVGYYTLYEMTYEGDTFDNIFLESVGMDAMYYLELKEDGTGILSIDNQELPITWKDGKVTIDKSGAFYTYRYQDGKITLEETTGDIMVFQKSDSKGGSAVPGRESSMTEQTPYQEYWDGDWYGWMVFSDATGDYEDWIGDYGDCIVTITVYDDDTGYAELSWLDGELFAETELSFGAGTTAGGCMMSESGTILNLDINHADWIVDPGASMVSDFDHMIYIESRMTDDEGEWIDYDIFLRPWGMDWEDMRDADTSGMLYENMMPLQYDSWYLPAIQSGAEMADVTGLNFSYNSLEEGEVSDEQMEGQGTGDWIPIGHGNEIGVRIPDGFTYNEEWCCYADSDFSLLIWLGDGSTYTSESEFTGAMTGKTVTKEITLGGRKTYMCEDPDNFNGPTTRYYVELDDIAGLAGCSFAVSSMKGDLAATQSPQIQDMVASISEKYIP